MHQAILQNPPFLDFRPPSSCAPSVWIRDATFRHHLSTQFYIDIISHPVHLFSYIILDLLGQADMLVWVQDRGHISNFFSDSENGWGILPLSPILSADTRKNYAILCHFWRFNSHFAYGATEGIRRPININLGNFQPLVNYQLVCSHTMIFDGWFLV